MRTGAGYRALEQRASEWTVTVNLCGLSTVLLHEIASFVPLAGARLMVTCRGGLPVFFCFERWLRSLAGQTRNIYQQAVFALTRCLRGHDCDYDMGFDEVGDALELGADADLLFALLQIFMNHRSRIVTELHCHRDLSGAFSNNINYLYAACGPRGADSAVSLLLQNGFSVNARDDGPFADIEIWKGKCTGRPKTIKTSLHRAVWSKRITAMHILLRCGAFWGLRGGTYDDRWFARYAYSPLWLALYLAKRSKDDKVDNRVAVLKCLLQHRLCPHDVAYRRGVYAGGEKACLLQLEAGGDFLFRVFKSCEPRCCCDKCEKALVNGSFIKYVIDNPRTST